MKLAGVTMFSRPRVVRAQLSQGPAAYIETLMAGLTAIMIETENGAGWQVFTRATTAEPWSQIGFPPPLATQVA